MGGNALKNTSTQRLRKNEYEVARVEIERIVQHAFPSARISTIPAYSGKTDFGDLDLLVESDSLVVHSDFNVCMEMLAERVSGKFHSTDVFRNKNSNVISCDYRTSPEQVTPGFQVDLILTPSKEFEFALGYYAYNDLGNLMTWVSRDMGQVLGHNGLWSPSGDANHPTKILLSQNFYESITFLGFDANRHRRGFDSMEEIFEFVSSSDYFNRDSFLAGPQNHAARAKFKKRNTQIQFVEWLTNHPLGAQMPSFQYPENKSDWLPRAFDWFPNFERDLRLMEQAATNAAESKKRFNGDKVSLWTGLENKELGELMMTFRCSFPTTESMHAYVIGADEDALRTHIMNLMESGNQPNVVNCDSRKMRL